MSRSVSIVQCSQCGQRLKVRTTAKSVRCPNCDETTKIEPEEEAAIQLQSTRTSALPEVEPEEYGDRRLQRGRRRKKRKRTSALAWLSIPLFILAVLSAMVTAWFTAAHFLGNMIDTFQGSRFSEHRGMGLLVLVVGTLVTMGFFYLAECVKHGRMVAFYEAFTSSDEER